MNTTQPAPILLFCYKRLDVLKATVKALQKNLMANESSLFIFSDGPKGVQDQDAVTAVRDFLTTITGFKSVETILSPVNKGLANSIIDGVSVTFKKYDRVIVLEDDLITSANFLAFMNQALHFYRDENVFSIAGFSLPIKGVPENSVYFIKRASSWGWATWRDRWQEIDWQVTDYDQFKSNRQSRRNFNKMGSDLSGMLDKQMNGKIDSWAIRWCFHQFKKQAYTVCPAVSKVRNNGFGDDATHTREKKGRYATRLDQTENVQFQFRKDIQLDPVITRQFTRHYSVPYRIFYKLQKLLSP